MAGRIRDDDVLLVKERANVADVIGDHVTLRSAGGGNFKGLCPFHEEKSPSFSVRPSVGSWHCFGCGEGGDVIEFLKRVEHLTFTEAVERLATRVGVQLRYEDGGFTPNRQQGQRSRLVEAHRVAGEFFAEQLASSGASIGRTFLAQRGFDLAAAERFGVGFAPGGWDALTTHLRGRKFSDQELLAGGLVSQGQRGVYDRFRGRLVWPIRDIAGDVIGFGARKLLESDQGPKYLNTPETPIYKKSSVLYGVDLAKREIARRRQAVVVEGYTDVMACHLAGVETAIATCGTAFGDEHIKILRRLLMDQNEFRGEVVFTFDGDSAGQKAALKAFQDDQKFVTQTFVAVEPAGLDPCDLRQTKGDAAVRDLVARRVPLFEFAIQSALQGHDLDTNEGRLAALDEAAPIIAGIRDEGLRKRYAVNLDKWLGFLDETFILNRIAEHMRRRPGAPAPRTPNRPPPPGSVELPGLARAGTPPPDPHDPALSVERGALKVVLQAPQLAGSAYDALDAAVFTAPAYAEVHAAVVAAGGATGAVATGGGARWVAAVEERAGDDAVRRLVRELAVEPIPTDEQAQTRYAIEVLARLEELSAGRRIAAVKSRLQRLNPLEQQGDYNRLFGELVALEQHRRGLRERAIGAL